VPLFEYRCSDCEALIEVFQMPSDPNPRLCGYRCPLSPEDPRDCRGMGSLSRVLSVPGGQVRGSLRRDRPSVEEAARAGMTVYENTPAGARKIAGSGPDFVSREPEEG